MTVPLYLNILGDEAWGLLSIVLTIYAFIAVIGSGMSQVLPREIAIRNISNTKTLMCDVAYGFERFFWVVSLLLSFVVFILADIFVDSWINLETMSYQDAVLAFKFLALQLLIQWPVACYHGFLLGLNEHRRLNVIQVLYTTLKHVACVTSLVVFEPSVFVYQVTFLIVSGMETLYTSVISRRLVGLGKNKCKWNAHEMNKIYGFVVGMMLTVLVGGALVQSDKLMLSGLLSVSSFGYYSIASMLSIAMLQIVYPVTRSVYPIYSEYIEKKIPLVELNEKLATILMSTLVPAVVFVGVFSSEVLLLWTNNEQLVKEVSVVLSILVVGTLINGMYNIPYTVYLASGNSKTPFWINVFSLVCIVMILPVMYKMFGVNGAAFSWVIVNIIAMTVGWRWLFQREYIARKTLFKLFFMCAVMVFVSIAMKFMFQGVMSMVGAGLLLAFLSGITLCSLKNERFFDCLR